MADIWTPQQRVIAFPIFGIFGFLGPLLGPTVGGWVGQSSTLTWRWVEWIPLCIAGGFLALFLLLMPETYAPVILQWKAKHLRTITANQSFVAEIDVGRESLVQRLKVALSRPFVIFFSEPIVMLLTLYLTLIYMITFSFFSGFPYIFGDTYGFSQGITNTMFVGIATGVCFNLALIPILYRHGTKEMAKAKARGDPKPPPEIQLWWAMIGAPALPISLFWIAWSTYPSVSYWSPLIA